MSEDFDDVRWHAAAFGFLSLVVAALIHVGSETAFILNSARLIPFRRISIGRRRAAIGATPPTS